MVTSNFNLIDIANLKEKIQSQADEFLTDLTLEGLEDFSRQVVSLVHGTLQTYVVDTYDLYAEKLKTGDRDLLRKFRDVDTGYQARMEEWINKNDVKVVPIEIPVEPTKPSFGPISPSGTLIGGSIIAGVICFFSIPAAIVFEFATLIASYMTLRHRNNMTKDYAMRLHQYEIEMTNLRSIFLKSITEDCIKWLEDGHETSNNILKNFGLEN